MWKKLILLTIIIIAGTGARLANLPTTSPESLLRPGFHEVDIHTFPEEMKRQRALLQERRDTHLYKGWKPGLYRSQNHAFSGTNTITFSKAKALQDFLASPETRQGTDSIAYLFATPSPEMLAKGKRYPLVIYLHGSGNIRKAPPEPFGFMTTLALPALQKKHPCFLLSPRLSERLVLYAPPEGHPDYPYNVACATPMLDILFELLDGFIAAHPIDINRIYIGGHSHGSSAVHTALKARPGFFAAATTSAGNPVVIDAVQVAPYTPIWTFVGAEDDIGKPVTNRWSHDSLAHYGARQNICWWLEGVGHNGSAKIQENTLELFDWLFAR